MTRDSAAQTLRVTLRPLVPTDCTDVEPWLLEAIAAVESTKPSAHMPASLAALDPYVGARWPGAKVEAVVVDEQGIAGLLLWRTLSLLERRSQSALVIEALTIRAGLRNLGYGAEAVYRLELAHPDAMAFAAIPRSNGLAIYFWLRVGYRPVWIDEDAVPGQDQERLWMVRASSRNASGVLPAH